MPVFKDFKNEYRRFKIFVFGFIVLIMATGCTTTRNVSNIHPFRDILIGESKSEIPVYLYQDGSRHQYYVMRHEMDYFIGGQKSTHFPDIVVPSGSQFEVSDILLESGMGGTFFKLRGVVWLNNQKVKYNATVDLIGIDIETWRQGRFFLSLPGKKDYVKEADCHLLPWHKEFCW